MCLPDGCKQGLDNEGSGALRRRRSAGNIHREEAEVRKFIMFYSASLHRTLLGFLISLIRLVLADVIKFLVRQMFFRLHLNFTIPAVTFLQYLCFVA